MTRTITLLTNLLISSTLFWSVPTVGGGELGADTESIVKVPADALSYCHMQFPSIAESTMTWDRPLLDESAGNSIDFYGPCDHDPVGLDEIRVQRRTLLPESD